MYNHALLINIQPEGVENAIASNVLTTTAADTESQIESSSTIPDTKGIHSISMYINFLGLDNITV